METDHGEVRPTLVVMPSAVRLPQIGVWDRPTRFGHWLFPVLIATSWISSQFDDFRWHVRSGLAVLALVVFRISWGFLGGTTARFSQFLKGPVSIRRYVRSDMFDRHYRSIGHNPLGGWSVIALLATLAAMTGSGLIAVDVDDINSGPLASLVSFDQGRSAAYVHHLAFKTLEVLVVLHLVAVALYWIGKRENLVFPMITGRKRVASGPVPLVPGTRSALVVSLLLSVAAVALVLHFA